ncbi:hypothetical protein Tco_0674178 [Tanacetum coccineum]
MVPFRYRKIRFIAVRCISVGSLVHEVVIRSLTLFNQCRPPLNILTSVPNSTALELTALQSGRSRSALVNVPVPRAPECHWFPFTKLSQKASGVTESLYYQVPLPGTLVILMLKHCSIILLTVCVGHYNDPETNSEDLFNLSISMLTPNNQLPHVQNVASSTSLEWKNIIGDKDDMSYRKQLRKPTADVVFLQRFLTHVETKTDKQAFRALMWIELCM